MQTCALKLVVRQMSFFLLATPFLLLHIAWPLKLLTNALPIHCLCDATQKLECISFTENKCRHGGNAKVGRQAGNHEMNRKSGRCYIGTTPTEPHDSNMPNVSCYNQSSVINTICNQNTFIKTTPAEMGWIWWVLQKWSIKKTIFVSGNNSIYGISASMFQNFFVDPIIPHILNSLVCKV